MHVDISHIGTLCVYIALKKELYVQESMKNKYSYFREEMKIGWSHFILGVFTFLHNQKKKS